MNISKKILLVASAFVSFVITPLYSPPLALAAPQNLAPNPSFEDGTAQPEGWLGALAGASYTWSSTEAHTGSRSICISNIQANRSVEWDTSPSLPVEAGKTYRIGAWAKGDSDRDASLMAGPLDANGAFLTGQAVRLPYNNTSWTFSERTFLADSNAARVVLTLGVNNPGGFTSSSVCFDDVIFEEEEPLSDTQMIAASIPQQALPTVKVYARNFSDFYRTGGKPLLTILTAWQIFLCAANPELLSKIAICLLVVLRNELIIGQVVNFIEDIAQDPPRDDFDEVFKLHRQKRFKALDDSGFMRAMAEHFTLMAEQRDILEAILVTGERLLGAIEADEPGFVILQGEALLKFLDLLVENKVDVQDSIARLQAEFGIASDSVMEETLTRFASEGLSNEEREVLQDEGLTPDEIQATEELLQDLPQGVNYTEFAEQVTEQWIDLIDSTLPTLDDVSTIVANVVDELKARSPNGTKYWRKRRAPIEPLLPLVLGNETVDTVKLAKKVLGRTKDKDASSRLAANLLATKLNIAAASLEAACILPVVNEAQDFLVQHPRGSGLRKKDKPRQALRLDALALNHLLDEYNKMGGACFD